MRLVSTRAPITVFAEPRPLGWLVWFERHDSPGVKRVPYYLPVDDCPKEAVANLCRGVEREYMRMPSQSYNRATAVLLVWLGFKAACVLLTWAIAGPEAGFAMLILALLIGM